MNERNTKQKEDILKVIKSTKIHPTMKEIYQLVKEINPTIGQATIYRNINRLTEEGKVIRILDPTDEYHYDGDTSEHSHFICTYCNKIIDIFNDYQKINKELEKKHNFQIDEKLIIYKGICEKCLKKNN